ncbi:MAG TPA: hypothetical protein VIC28_18910 [Thermoanaerobaculia bacterium]
MKPRSLRGLLGAALLLAAGPVAGIENRIGIGVHLWTPAGELRENPLAMDENEVTGLVSYQLVLCRPLKLQVDLEYFPNGFGGTGIVFVFPQGFIVLGDRWYLAGGAGWFYSTRILGKTSDVVYLARVGTDRPIRPRLHLDVFAERRAPEVNDLTRLDEDTFSFAAVLRLRL